MGTNIIDFEIKNKFSGRLPNPIGRKDLNKLAFCLSFPKPIREYNGLSEEEDAAYERFLEANIYFGNKHTNKWEQITHETFVVMMALAANVPHKWPEQYQYEDRWHFNLGWYYGIYSWREAIRRHLHRRAIVDDIDLRIVSR